MFSSLLNGFIFLIVIIFIFDRINLFQVNDFILLRISNPLHYMTEFTGDAVNGALNIDYILKIFLNYFLIINLVWLN